MIRSLKSTDYDDLKRILIDTNHFNDEEIKVALELIETALNKDMMQDYIIYVYVIDDNGKTGGYICYGKRPLTDSTYDLYWIAVDPLIQGTGAGRKLINFMEEDLLKNRNGNLILIETSGKDGYEGERKFYEKNGYEIQTTIKNFYRPGDDLVVYHKYLKI
jgi:ribosomal protein S18 acetylase RimI-like enzyme